MRHRKNTFKMQRTRSHRAALVSNMVTSLFKYEKIRTTDAKAKAVKGFAEHVISVAKQGTLAARRQCARTVKDNEVLKKLFDVIVPRMKDKTSGFITITKLWTRPGDAALMALMELHGAPEKAKQEEKKVVKQPKFRKKGAPRQGSGQAKKEKPVKKEPTPRLSSGQATEKKAEKKAEKK